MKMPNFVITEEGVAVTNVALMSLRQAVAQQIEFETILEEVVQRQQDGFGSETATTEKKDRAAKKAAEEEKNKDENKPADAFVSPEAAQADGQADGQVIDGANDNRGAALNIKV